MQCHSLGYGNYLCKKEIYVTRVLFPWYKRCTSQKFERAENRCTKEFEIAKCVQHIIIQFCEVYPPF